MTLKEALRVLIEEEHIGDFVYTIRSRAVEQEDRNNRFQGNSWDHPRVVRFSDAVNRLIEEYKQS